MPMFNVTEFATMALSRTLEVEAENEEDAVDVAESVSEETPWDFSDYQVETLDFVVE